MCNHINDLCQLFACTIHFLFYYCTVDYLDFYMTLVSTSDNSQISNFSIFCIKALHLRNYSCDIAVMFKIENVSIL